MNAGELDVIAAWQAAARAALVNPLIARYRKAGAQDLGRVCASCGYHDGAECMIVAARADADSVCDLWRPSPRDGRDS
jgi:hypothetical protein